MTEPRAAANDPVSEDWHARSPEDMLAQLGSSVGELSATDAAQRLATNGPNELKESKGVSPLHMFLSQFKSLIIWVLIAGPTENLVRVVTIVVTGPG